MARVRGFSVGYFGAPVRGGDCDSSLKNYILASVRLASNASVRLGAKAVVERSGETGGFVISLRRICGEIGSIYRVGGTTLPREIRDCDCILD